MTLPGSCKSLRTHSDSTCLLSPVMMRNIYLATCVSISSRGCCVSYSGLSVPWRRQPSCGTIRSTNKSTTTVSAASSASLPAPTATSRSATATESRQKLNITATPTLISSSTRNRLRRSQRRSSRTTITAWISSMTMLACR